MNAVFSATTLIDIRVHNPFSFTGSSMLKYEYYLAVKLHPSSLNLTGKQHIIDQTVV
jgi:hypothetical protein